MGRFTETERTITARFTRPGVSYSGVVLGITDVPVPEFDGTRIIGPKFDVNGTIVEQVDVLLDVSGAKTVVHTGGGISFAIATALQAIKADDLEIGDSLTITYDTDEDADEGIPTKLYTAVVVKAKTKTPKSK